MINRPNNDIVNAFKTEFIGRNDKSLIYERLMSKHIGLTGLLAFWNMAQIDAANNGDFWSASGGDKTLTNNNIVTAERDGILPYAQFVAASSKYLERADENSFDISANETHIGTANQGITIGGLFYIDSFTGTTQHIISKLLNSILTGAYALALLDPSKQIVFAMYNIVQSGATQLVTHPKVLSTGSWHHVAAGYNRSTNKMFIFIDGVIEEATPAITSIQNTAIPFRIGSRGDGSFPFDGRASNVFICSSAINYDEIRYISNLSLELVR